MTEREALKLALEALEKYAHDFGSSDLSVKAMYVARNALAQPERDYERGFIDGMQKQMQSSVDKAVNAMTQRTWVGLTPQERDEINEQVYGAVPHHVAFHYAIEAKLKSKNNADH